MSTTYNVSAHRSSTSTAHSLSHPQHRPLPPTAPAQPARSGAPDALGMRDTFRVPEALDLIRQDFEGISTEISSLKMQRDEYEAKGKFHSHPSGFFI